MVPARAIANLVKIGERAVFLELGKSIRNSHLAPHFAFGRPELIFDVNLGNGDGL